MSHKRDGFRYNISNLLKRKSIKLIHFIVGLCGAHTILCSKMVYPEFIARHRHDWPFEITLKCYKVKICFVGLLFLLSKLLKWYETFSPSGTQTVPNIRSKLNSFRCFSPYACTMMIKKAITKTQIYNRERQKYIGI